MRKLLFYLVCLFLLIVLCGTAQADVTIKSGLEGVQDIHVPVRGNVIWAQYGHETHSWEEVPNGKFYLIAGWTAATLVYKSPDIPASFGRTDFLAWKVIFSDGQIEIVSPGACISLTPNTEYATNINSDITLLAIWEGLEHNGITLQGPESIRITENAVRTVFQISVTDLTLGSADHVRLRFDEGFLESGQYKIPYLVGLDNFPGGWHIEILREPGWSPEMLIQISEDAWRSAKAGVYQGAYTWKAEFLGKLDGFRVNEGKSIGNYSGSIPITLTIGYSINVTSGGNGTVTTSAAMAKENETVTLNPVPDEGFRFREWQVISGGVTIEDNRFVMGSSDVEIRAVFEQIATVTFKDRDGTVLQSSEMAWGETPVYSGETPVMASGDPHTDYIFDGWSPAISPVSGDAIYTPQFREVTNYLMSFDANGGSGGMETIKVPVDVGKYELPVCSIIPPPGMVFNGWQTEDSTGQGHSGYGAGYTLQNISSDLTISPRWVESRILTEVYPQNSGTAVYDGKNGVFTAIPNPGYKFLGWNYADNSGSGPANYVSETPEYKPDSVQEGTYTAHFEQIIYSVTIEVVGNGTVSSDQPGYKAGSIVMLNVVPDPGYRLGAFNVFSRKIGEQDITVPFESEYHFTMPLSPVVIHAEFEKIVYPVSVSAEPAAAGRISGAGDYSPGTEVALSATVNAGYRFTGWRILSGGADISDGRFTMPSEPVNVKALFERVYTVICDSAVFAVLNEDGTESSGVTEAAAGKTVFLRLKEDAAPENGCYFTGEFKINGTTLSRELGGRFTMPAKDTDISAVQAPRETATLHFSQGSSLNMNAEILAQLRSGEETAALISQDAAGNTVIDLNGSGVPDLVLTSSGSAVSLLAGYDAFGCFDFSFSGAADRFATVTFLLPAPAFGTPDLVLPGSTVTIGENAFEGIAAAAAVIPDGCSTIGSYAFMNCTNLTRIRIPDSVTAIGTDIFNGCGMVYVFSSEGSAAETYCRTHTGCVFVAE